ncbi:hypothetical protein CCACVL1_25635 [Corchorus capsularis]|uniref:Uncharacterized protein n=1 Tax=Corchorus capsularis TaxID=210143 RepID=A0A1R3GIU1_COCAP|nr:hypothetical protein CCACVL1_25635 [Corchorus capsularis]
MEGPFLLRKTIAWGDANDAQIGRRDVESYRAAMKLIRGLDS